LRGDGVDIKVAVAFTDEGECFPVR